MTEITSISVDPAAAQPEVQGQGTSQGPGERAVPVQPAAVAETAKVGVMHSAEVTALPSHQLAALKEIMAGRGPGLAAAAAGVHRGTLYRWMKEDRAFHAALIKCQIAARDAARNQLLCVADVAASIVRRELRAGDPKIAMALLRAMGILDRLTIDPKLPDAGDQAYEAFTEKSDQLLF